VRQGERRMAEIRWELATYDPENIYNMDETGLQYRCLPSRNYIAAGQRWRVRGSKAMKAKVRVALVLACNAIGSHKIPVAIIGCAAVPQCFKPPKKDVHCRTLRNSRLGWKEPSTRSGSRRFWCRACDPERVLPSFLWSTTVGRTPNSSATASRSALYPLT